MVLKQTLLYPHSQQYIPHPMVSSSPLAPIASSPELFSFFLHRNAPFFHSRIILNSYLPARNQIIILMSLHPSPLPEDTQATKTPSHPYFSFKKTTLLNAPTVLVQFAPIRWQEAPPADSPLGQTAPEFKTYPVFNDDCCFFTPCFMLHHDKVRTPYNLPAFLSLHETRLQEISQEREELLVPKPSKGNSFCCVCRSFFDDYLEHVARPDHISSMRENKFCTDIQSLCNRFTPTPSKNIPKVKPIRKQPAKKAQRPSLKEMMRSTSTEASPLMMGDISS